MKFTKGYWLNRPGVEAADAVQIREVKIEKNRVYLYSVPYPQDVRAMGGPVLEMFISSPKADIIRTQAYHFMGSAKKEPQFEMAVEDYPLDVTETEDGLSVKSGKTELRITKNPCSFSYYYEGKKLTKIGDRFGHAMISTISTPEGPFMRCQMDLDLGEKVYGLGERFTPFVKNGQVVDMWNEDGGTCSEISYKNIPFYMTNKGYGVLVNTSGKVSYEICSEVVTRVQFSVPGEKLDFMVVGGGDGKTVLQNYTALTGRPALPPAWTFGLWLTTSFTTNYDETTTSGFIDGMADRDIPLHVFHFDCYWMEAYEWCNFTWDPKTFPDPEGMLRRYHDRGLKICVWINPYIGQKSPLFEEGMRLGYLMKKTNGDVWQTDMWQAGMGLVDFTNPGAVEWYQAKLKTLLDMGVDCFKTDFGERIPVKDIAYFDGSDPVKMHNYYTYLYNRAVFELLERERGTGEAVVFARSATVGGQQFPAHWGGDCSAAYSSMAETIRSGLSLACAGFGFWSHDISGFENTAPADIYKRWCQFGLLSSHSRLHGSSSYRVPWLFDEEACRVLRKFVKLKCALMPYLYLQAVKAHEEGIPMMRPMFVEFPGDRACETLDKQYMLGDSLLVAPVFKESGEVEYYLPEGTWVNLLTGQTVTGGRWQKETHDYFSLPLMLRPGSVIAVGANSEKPDYDYAEGVKFLLYLPEAGMEAASAVTDLSGKTVMTACARREGNRISLSVNGGNGNYTYEVLGKELLSVVCG